MSAPLWGLPGLDVVTFAAAANYLHHADEQQNITNDSSAGQNSEYISDSDARCNIDDKGERLRGCYGRPDDPGKAARILTETFLDRLAQIFASERKVDKTMASILGLDQSKAQRLPADDVTATALVKIEPRKGETGKIKIFVTKNKGLNEDDKKFGDVLVAGFNGHPEPSSTLPKFRRPKSDTTWDKIVQFNMVRVCYYVNSILQEEPNWDGYKKKVLEVLKALEKEGNHRSKGEPSKNPPSDQSESIPNIRKGIINIFVQIDKLIIGCQKYCQNKGRSTEADQVLQLAHGIRSDKTFKILPRFGNMGDGMKDGINYLGRLEAAWRTISDYAARHQHYRFSFHYPEAPDLSRYRSIVNPNTLSAKINSYPSIMVKRGTALTTLQNTEVLNLAVHCEMQLLLHLDASKDAENCFPYFGCSKLSCWMCHEILKSHSKYRMKRSHGQIVGLWAFDSTNPSAEIIYALKDLQDKLMKKILKEAVRVGLAEKSESMRSLKSLKSSKPKQNLQGIEHIHKRAEPYKNVKRMLDESARIVKKHGLDKRKMSTADISTSTNDNLKYQEELCSTTQDLTLSHYFKEQEKINEQKSSQRVSLCYEFHKQRETIN
jgi:OTT_1508-like deaminase